MSAPRRTDPAGRVAVRVLLAALLLVVATAGPSAVSAAFSAVHASGSPTTNSIAAGATFSDHPTRVKADGPEFHHQGSDDASASATPSLLDSRTAAPAP